LRRARYRRFGDHSKEPQEWGYFEMFDGEFVIANVVWLDMRGQLTSGS
jgi:hypothetical protein